MLAIQLDLFKETTPEDILRAEIDFLKERQDNLRKGLFSRHSELTKMVFSLQNHVESLQSQIKEMNKEKP